MMYRRQYAESWRKMQELRAQIQAQLKLADTLRKLGEHAGQPRSFSNNVNLEHQHKNSCADIAPY
jgi:hypothetical protein